jgi:hypothetical protein
MADFVAKAKNNSTGEDWTIIAESKGSLGKLVSKGRIKHAKKQVSATKARFAGTAAKLPLALCSTVFFAKQGKGASCNVIDPPNETGSEEVILDTLDAWRAAYAKAFRFVGLDAASNQVLRGEPITSLHRIDDADTAVHDDREQSVRRRRRARNALDRLNADLLLDVGDSAIAIDPKVLVMLREAGVSEGMAPHFEEIAETRRGQPSRGHSFLNYLGLGCVPYEDLDEMGG